MKHSETINEIAKAMSGLQSEIRDAEKDTQGHGYKYADLYQILSLIRPLLSKHGLAFTQHVSNADDKVVIETMIMHESGQWIQSELSMPPTPNNRMSAAQSVGSAITYGRRYSLTAIFGITQCTEDDDAANQAPPYTSRPKPVPAPRGTSQPTRPVQAAASAPKATPGEVAKLRAMLKSASVPEEKVLETYKLSSLDDISFDDLAGAMRKLNATLAKQLGYASA